VNITLLYGFEKIKAITRHFFDNALNESFGDAVRTIDRLFSSLNSSVIDPLSQSLLAQLNFTLDEMFNGSFDSFNEAFAACESVIKEQITALIQGYIDSLVETFVSSIFDVIDMIIDFREMLIDWLFDGISLNKAEVMLTIWVVRE
jgi:phage-related protein